MRFSRIWDIRIAVGISFLIWCDAATAGQVISHTDVDAKTIVWRIDEPVVTQYDTEYPEIIFSTGDRVSVEAGGCVQTGGSGDTWKHYVNPKGDNSDRLYSGLISIPTATAGLVRIGTVIGQTFEIKTIPEGTELAKRRLHLGYQDESADAYGDNGYYDHDNGTDDQCKGVGSAYVILTIQHKNPPNIPPLPEPNQVPQAPMDLWWTEVDHNLLPLNSVWGHQINPGGVPNARHECNDFHDEGDHLNLGSPPGTTQNPTVDEASGLTSLICGRDHPAGTVHGHINWGFVTYRGTLFFADWQVNSSTQTGDDDYDLELLRNDEAGVTLENHFRYHEQGKTALDVEFNASETIDTFDLPWWTSFRSAVQSHPANTGDWTAAQAFVDGREAIVVGLIGIDNQHNGHAEVHPVHALAVHVRDDATGQVWELFARNWGNEGFCSQDQHLLPFNSITLFFPKPADATSFQVDSSTTRFHGNNAAIKWGQKQISSGVLITFSFPAAEERPIAHGELYLRQAPAASTHPDPIRDLGLRKPKMPILSNSYGPRENLDPVLNRLSPKQRQTFFKELNTNRVENARTAVNTDVARDDSIVTEAAAAVLKPTDTRIMTSKIKDHAVFDVIAEADRQLQLDALTKAVGGESQLKEFLNRFIEEQGAPQRTRHRPKPIRENPSETIAYLLNYIQTSGCSFVRNDATMSAEDAAEHIRHKYEYYRSAIATPEDFIELAASRSIFSGRPYFVQTPRGRIKATVWLTRALREYRRTHNLTG
jgi:hypothetical protein